MKNQTKAKAAKAPKAAPVAVAAPVAAPKAKNAPKAAPAPKKAAPVAIAPVAVAAPIHVNKTGRICLSKEVYGMIGDAAFCVVTADAKGITLAFKPKAVAGALPVRMGGGRPYVSDTRTLKQFGFDGSFSLDPVVTRVGDNAFALAIADAVKQTQKAA